MYGVLYEQVTCNSRGKNVRDRCYVGASIFFFSPNLAFFLSLPLTVISSL